VKQRPITDYQLQITENAQDYRSASGCSDDELRKRSKFTEEFAAPTVRKVIRRRGGLDRTGQDPLRSWSAAAEGGKMNLKGQDYKRVSRPAGSAPTVADFFVICNS
jgi:hypothetical protein